MLAVGTAVACVWAVLFGAAYLARGRLRLSRPRAAFMVVGCYAVLAALALAWFGLSQNGALACFGMLLPCAAALLLVRLSPGR